MFSKTNKPNSKDAPASVPVPSDLPDLGKTPVMASAQPAPRPLPARAVSTLASDLTFEGNVVGPGELVVDGTVRGDVKVSRLTVGETGNVEGNVMADYVEVRGRVVGGVTGKQVKLISTAYVDGDISHEQLAIDVGAYFQGRCLQGRKDGQGAQPASPAQAYTQPTYAQPLPTAAPVDTGQLIELKPAG
ncbi:MAG TPA: polymer-forming cytoskeletal protein [Caulobacteraceae bacterium]|jgi:cytoskeletal protein CcmA (bactofilin family)|nr:polymer-forming cytoskeletal protein [Caulobacteraceae bacterium]